MTLRLRHLRRGYQLVGWPVRPTLAEALDDAAGALRCPVGELVRTPLGRGEWSVTRITAPRGVGATERVLRERIAALEAEVARLRAELRTREAG